MEEWEEIVGRHRSAYEKMTLQDAVKLVYQNEFGAEHLLADEAAAHDMLAHEYDEIGGHRCEAMFEPIGNGLCRMHMNAAGFDQTDLFLLEKLFFRTAGKKRGSRAALLRKLKRLGLFRFYGMHKGADAVSELADYVRTGVPSIRHSREFREAYQPHYRVVEQKYADCYAVLRWIAQYREKEKCVIAIDGRCGSGKTTLAQRIQEIFGCGVIHMDDFFLPQDMRTEKRMSEPGGNVHYERVKDEVLKPLCAGVTVRYRPYDCMAGVLGDAREIQDRDLNIVEGAYALHPALHEYYTDSMVLDVAEKVQKERIVLREGNLGAGVFFEKWMPLEQRYIDGCGIYEQAGAIFESGADGSIKKIAKQLKYTEKEREKENEE
ncbi:MAG: hypothetical protein VB081_00315 [Christensenella sp.]|uniref:uridine kinase family protein n=1 Tax=Christensenella sp. TaxID=1935934 RepID=UPI002B2047FF|nr:hypothetical protein [Christensenella sp.]MEA5001931.1 hypothetical protein [Christensenella sp.]